MNASCKRTTFGRCRCCLKYGNHKDLLKISCKNYSKVWLDVFSECFVLMLTTDAKLTTLICSACVERLIDANNFKTMVIESEKRLLADIHGTSSSDAPNSKISSLKKEKEVKVKKEITEEGEDPADYLEVTYLDEDLLENQGDDRQMDRQVKGEKPLDGDRSSHVNKEVLEIVFEEEAEKSSDSSESKAPLLASYLRAPNRKTLRPVEPAFHYSLEIERKTENDSRPEAANSSDLIEGEVSLLGRFPRDSLPPLPTADTLQHIEPHFYYHLNRLKGQPRPKPSEEWLNEDHPTTATTKTVPPPDYTVKVGEISNTLLFLEHTNVTPFRRKYSGKVSCFFCKNTYESITEVKEHLIEHKKENTVRKIFTNNSRIRYRDFAVYVDTSDMRCTICKERFTKFLELKSHLINTHKLKYNHNVKDKVIPFKLTDNDIYECQVCGLSIETFGSMERHMNTHYTNYLCKECGVGFITHNRLKDHIARHDTGSYPCPICKKIFGTKKKMSDHVISVHKSKKRYKCPKCPEVFRHYIPKKRHLVEVHGAEPLLYKCKVCDNTYYKRYALSLHIRKDHMNERNAQCEICSYTCFGKKELSKHMEKHNRESSYQCYVCQKLFLRKAKFDQHLKTHDINVIAVDEESSYDYSYSP